MAPGYNHCHQLFAEASFHTWDEEDPLIQEPAMVNDVDDNQRNMIAKENTIDITWTGHTSSVQPSEI